VNAVCLYFNSINSINAILLGTYVCVYFSAIAVVIKFHAFGWWSGFVFTMNSTVKRYSVYMALNCFRINIKFSFACVLGCFYWYKRNNMYGVICIPVKCYLSIDSVYTASPHCIFSSSHLHISPCMCRKKAKSWFLYLIKKRLVLNSKKSTLMC